MWSYQCVLCGCKGDDYLCEQCKEIKKITDIYGVDTVYDTLKRVYIRDTKPIENRTEKEANEVITRSRLKIKKNESE
jgi:hypothetical protein